MDGKAVFIGDGGDHHWAGLKTFLKVLGSGERFRL